MIYVAIGLVCSAVLGIVIPVLIISGRYDNDGR